MKRAWSAALGLAVLFALGARVPAATSTPDAPAGIPDDRIGLVPLDITAIPVPDAVRDNLSEPGERPLPARWNDAAPPVIPHGIADFLPITKTENACIECHAVAEKAEGEPTPIPESHYRDLRNAPDTVRESIAGSRSVCTSCHVPQTEAAPLPVGTD